MREGAGAGGGGPSTNSGTARNSAKSFIRKRCAKASGIQGNWNEVNWTRNKKVINEIKWGSRENDLKCL